MAPFRLSELFPLLRATRADDPQWRAEAESGVRFLRHNAQREEIVIYAVGWSGLIHGMLMPSEALTPEWLEQAQRDNDPGLENCWTIEKVIGGPERYAMALRPPLGDTPFEGGEKLVFRRCFPGYERGLDPVEISQKLVHSLELHYVETRRAYCRLDANGDLEDVIRVLSDGDPEGRDGIQAVTILRADLDRFMALAGMSLVLRFDFTRRPDHGFMGFHNSEPFERFGPDHHYHGALDPQGSYVNGALVVPPRVTREALVDAWKHEDDPARRRYATYWAFDIRSGEVVEVSCSPEATSNYFEASDRPLDMSPAFFRPDVLHKYKADPDKYTLDDWGIGCRGAWHLRGTDVNEAGQVHAYLCDLRRLPYSEQLYWLSFNEKPKALISDRAYLTDFLGEWDTTTHPLEELRALVSRLDQSGVTWWKPRGEPLLDAVHYPRTQSPKEWATEILALDQLVVEGLMDAPLRALAIALGRKELDRLRGIRLLQEILTGEGMNEERARAVIAPLGRLHDLRNVVAGHAGGSKKEAALRQARSIEGGLPAHFLELVRGCVAALESIERRIVCQAEPVTRDPAR